MDDRKQWDTTEFGAVFRATIAHRRALAAAGGSYFKVTGQTLADAPRPTQAQIDAEADAYEVLQAAIRRYGGVYDDDAGPSLSDRALLGLRPRAYHA